MTDKPKAYCSLGAMGKWDIYFNPQIKGVSSLEPVYDKLTGFVDKKIAEKVVQALLKEFDL